MPRPLFSAAFSYLLPQFIRSRISPLAKSGYSLDFPNGQISGGNNRGQNAVDLQTQRTTNSSRVASGTNSFLAGINNTASSTNIAVMGFNNAGTGNQSFRAGVSNTGSGANAFTSGSGNNTVALIGFSTGTSNTRSGTASFIAGSGCSVSQNSLSIGLATSVSGTSSVGLGRTPNVSASNSIAMGYVHSTGSGSYLTILGAYRGVGLGIQGITVFSASVEPFGTVSGKNQNYKLVLGRTTTNATTAVLTSNSTTTAAASNSLTLANNSAVFFCGEIIANVTGGGDTKQWIIEGAIKRGSNAASTALVGTPTVTSNYADAGASTWTVAISANTTLGCLTINVTGQASTTIRWVCSLNVTQVAF
jgi:hypothetical protein